jgi:hypothetical protein
MISMKIVLACLMCLVLGASQSFAIDGGPFGGGGTQVTVTGIYAGVLIPLPITLDPGPPAVTVTDNSLALFTLGIPKVGLATGTAAVFRNGIFYPGTIQGTADPDSAKLTGLINAFFQETVASTSTTDFIFQYNANGQFVNAKIVPNINSSNSSTARIRGKASLTYTNDAGDPNGDSGGPISYKIRGFKQAEATN